MNSIHPKVAGATVAAELAVIFLWGLSFVVTIPMEVAAAVTGIFTFAGGWLPSSPPST